MVGLYQQQGLGLVSKMVLQGHKGGVEYVKEAGK